MSDLLTLASFSFKISAINELFKAFPMNSSFDISPSLSTSIVDHFDKIFYTCGPVETK